MNKIILKFTACVNLAGFNVDNQFDHQLVM